MGAAAEQRRALEGPGNAMGCGKTRVKREIRAEDEAQEENRFGSWLF